MGTMQAYRDFLAYSAPDNMRGDMVTHFVPIDLPGSNCTTLGFAFTRAHITQNTQLKYFWFEWATLVSKKGAAVE